MCPVSISAAVPNDQGCSPSTGRRPIPVGLVRGVAERRWPPSFSPTELLWENHRVLLDDVGRRKWDRLPPGSVPWRCGALPVIRHSGLLGADPRVRALGTCGEPSRPRHIRALGTCGSGLRRRRRASCVAALITARALRTLVLPSPSSFRRGWPPPGLSPPCVRALGGAHVPVWGVCAPSRPSGPYQGCWHLRPPGG